MRTLGEDLWPRCGAIFWTLCGQCSLSNPREFAGRRTRPGATCTWFSITMPRTSIPKSGRGWRCAPATMSTTRRRMRPGSIKWNSGFAGSPSRPFAGAPSKASRSWWPRLTTSYRHTTRKPGPLRGRRRQIRSSPRSVDFVNVFPGRNTRLGQNARLDAMQSCGTFAG